MIRVNDLFGILVRGSRRRDEDNLVKTKGLADLLGSPKVTDVDRVECAAEQADLSFRDLLLRSHLYDDRSRLTRGFLWVASTLHRHGLASYPGSR
jgi:hypothetical protein